MSVSGIFYVTFDILYAKADIIHMSFSTCWYAHLCINRCLFDPFTMSYCTKLHVTILIRMYFSLLLLLLPHCPHHKYRLLHHHVLEASSTFIAISPLWLNRLCTAASPACTRVDDHFWVAVFMAFFLAETQLVLYLLQKLWLSETHMSSARPTTHSGLLIQPWGTYHVF